MNYKIRSEVGIDRRFHGDFRGEIRGISFGSTRKRDTAGGGSRLRRKRTN